MGESPDLEQLSEENSNLTLKVSRSAPLLKVVTEDSAREEDLRMSSTTNSH